MSTTSKALGQAALALLPLAVAAFAAAVGQWVIVGLMLLLAGLAGIAQWRPVQKRVPLLRTSGMRLAAIYEAGYAIRRELQPLKRQRPPPDSCDEWYQRAREWDATIWPEVTRTRDNWLALKRSVHSLPDRYYSNWPDALMHRLDERLELLNRLMNEYPD
jgi:hypothetical protein